MVVFPTLQLIATSPPKHCQLPSFSQPGWAEGAVVLAFILLSLQSYMRLATSQHHLSTSVCRVRKHGGVQERSHASGRCYWQLAQQLATLASLNSVLTATRQQMTYVAAVQTLV